VSLFGAQYKIAKAAKTTECMRSSGVREEGPVNGAAFMREIVHPDYRGAFKQAIENTLQKGEPFRFEGLMDRPDGTRRHIEVDGNLQPETDSTQGRILGTTRDITELRKTGEDQRENATHLGELASIVASSGDVILRKGPNRIITGWNHAATRVFGYSANETIGTSTLKLILEHLRLDEKTIIETYVADGESRRFVPRRMGDSSTRRSLSPRSRMKRVG
jgi:PAS domain S-box-containing protein